MARTSGPGGDLPPGPFCVCGIHCLSSDPRGDRPGHIDLKHDVIHVHPVLERVIQGDVVWREQIFLVQLIGEILVDDHISPIRSPVGHPRSPCLDVC